MQWITLKPNVPQDLDLAYSEGRPVKNGWMLTALGGKALFLSLSAGLEVQARLRELNLRRGDRARICMTISYEGGKRTTRYQVHRATGPRWGQQADGTFVVPVIGARA